MTRISVSLVAIVLCVAALTPHAQQFPAFDVVSIRPNVSGSTASALTPQPNGVVGTNVTVNRLIAAAYRVASFQVVHAPSWFESDHFDVNARSAQPVALPQLAGMLQSLLAERFGLRLIRERRDLSVLELRLDAAGHTGLRPAERPCALVGDQVVPTAEQQAERPRCFTTRAGEMLARGVTLEMLTFELTRYVDRRVVDRTERAGTFDFELRWQPDGGVLAPAGSDPPGLPTALREQVGLRLVSGRAPVDVLVVAAAHRPEPD